MNAEQRELYNTLVEEYGEPPEGTTHFDAHDPTETTWVKIDEAGRSFYYNSTNGYYDWRQFDMSRFVTELVEIPKYKERPYKLVQQTPMLPFELEDKIMSSWNSVEDLKLFYKMHGESLDNEGQNMMIGLIELVSARHEELFSVYEKLVRERVL